MYRRVSVVGLGYVGLPVAVAFGKTTPVIGFDINDLRITELSSGKDRNGEVPAEELRNAKIKFTSDSNDLSAADFHVITVPTPIDSANRPNLGPALRASETVGRLLKRGDIVVYESTVYPGATEEDFVPVLEAASGLLQGLDFGVGYSPERINPGDKDHTFTRVTKVVAGNDARTTDIIAAVYGSVVNAGVYRAASIKVAEAAKVIENIQRDLNIALMNELAIIFDRLRIDTGEVLAAAGTKWNFLKFKPGLVGGHCIGVDPYYLTDKAERLGYIPQVILAGRRINDNMAQYIAQRTVKELARAGHNVSGATVTILGVTFKEGCPDIRNSKVFNLVSELRDYGIHVQVSDPIAHADEVMSEHALKLLPVSQLSPAHALVVAVAHEQYRSMTVSQLMNLTIAPPILIDVKGIFDPADLARADFRFWRL